MGSCSFTGGRRVHHKRRTGKRRGRKSPGNSSVFGSINTFGNGVFDQVRGLTRRTLKTGSKVRKNIIGYR